MRRFTSLLLALSVAAAACTSGEDAGEDPAGSAGGALLSLLAAVPDTPDTRLHVLLNDYVGAAVQGGLVRPARASTDEQTVAYLADMMFENRRGLSVFPDFWGPHVALVEAWRSELGFSILDADGDVFAGAPERRFRIIFGAIDPDEVEQAVRSDPNYSDLLDTDEHEGSRFYTWGARAEADMNRASAARPVGRGGQLAVLDDRVIWTLDEREMVAALDADAGTVRSLADFEDFRLIAETLEESGAYTALLTNDSLAVENVVDFATAQRPEAAEEIRRLQGESGFLLRYDAIGIGASLSSDGVPRTIIVLVNPDEDTARENARRFADIVTNGRSIFTGRPWSAVASVDTSTASGRVTAVTLTTPSPSYFRGLLDVVDSLLLYTTGE